MKYKVHDHRAIEPAELSYYHGPRNQDSLTALLIIVNNFLQENKESERSTTMFLSQKQNFRYQLLSLLWLGQE